ncbi:MAG: cyclohexanone monooxygenase [Phenylobacterium zucineum]|nr:MAG: cyclohexanone monooxygenase [Phenylobacterium zucineum]
MANSVAAQESYDVVIVGAGFSGLYLLHKLRGLGLTAKIFEAGEGVGGTWYWNRYPGARVDIESQEYSYSFSPELEDEWVWSERYATQPELLRYVNHVADRFDLRRDIKFDTRVISAHFDDGSHRWRVQTHRGDDVVAKYCVMATGCLSVTNEPRFPGVETFKGNSYHTGRWPHDGVDFTGKRVAVIGTGSSAIQSIPQIATQAAHLHVFQRTPNFSVPAHNGPQNPEKLADWKANRDAYRQMARESGAGIVAVEASEASALQTPAEERQAVFEKRWARGGFALGGAFIDVMVNLDANALAAEFVHNKIRSIVKDPETAEILCPKGYPFGTKRLCVDTGYYETFNRDNVTLVDLTKGAITAITSTGVRTETADYDFDAIVYAIGFDAMTGALNNIDIKGRAGERLREKWADGPKTYLGLMVAGFPNLFLVTGPGSPSVLSNMMVSIEQHVDWITDCIGYLNQRQIGVIEATRAAENGWVAHVNEVADMTLYPQANSWYLGANVPGKPRVFMPYVGGVGPYRQICADIAAKGYEGFALGTDTPAG